MAAQTRYATPMQPIIRRTITITITETWTITWPDGQETVWQETHEVAYPAVNESGTSLPPLTEEEAPAENVLAADTADQPAEDEQD